MVLIGCICGGWFNPPEKPIWFGSTVIVPRFVVTEVAPTLTLLYAPEGIPGNAFGMKAVSWSVPRMPMVATGVVIL